MLRSDCVIGTSVPINLFFLQVVLISQHGPSTGRIFGPTTDRIFAARETILHNSSLVDQERRQLSLTRHGELMGQSLGLGRK